MIQSVELNQSYKQTQVAIYFHDLETILEDLHDLVLNQHVQNWISVQETPYVLEAIYFGNSLWNMDHYLFCCVEVLSFVYLAY